MYGLWLKQGLASESIDDLIEKLEKITEHIKANKERYVSGKDVDSCDVNYGWALLNRDASDEIESSDMDWFFDDEDDDDFAEEDDNSSIYDDEDEEDF